MEQELGKLRSEPSSSRVRRNGFFLAGADLKWLAALPDAQTATQAAREGQAVFEQIATFKVPVVCAIHGACAGGGYELALACNWRIASDAAETRIGLPEVRLGLIPGWGGCTRLSRLIGAQAAVEFILKASLVPAPMALTAGLVDEVVPVAELKSRAKATALRLATEGVPSRTVPTAPAPDFFSKKRAAASLHWRGQPAVPAVLDAVEKGAGLPLAAALDLEAGLFGSVASGEVAKNLIHIFHISEKGPQEHDGRMVFHSGREHGPRLLFAPSGLSGLASWDRALRTGALRMATASLCAIRAARRSNAAWRSFVNFSPMECDGAKSPRMQPTV